MLDNYKKMGKMRRHYSIIFHYFSHFKKIYFCTNNLQFTIRISYFYGRNEKNQRDKRLKGYLDNETYSKMLRKGNFFVQAY